MITTPSGRKSRQSRGPYDDQSSDGIESTKSNFKQTQQKAQDIPYF